MMWKSILLGSVLVFGAAWSYKATAQSYKYTTLNYPAAGNTYLRGINTAGQVLMETSTRDQCFVVTKGHIAAINTGHVTDICSGINDAGSIVGWHRGPTKHGTGFVYRDGRSADIVPPGSLGSGAGAISNSGLVTGYYFDQASIVHAYVFDGKIFHTIDLAGKILPQGMGVNDAGQVTLIAYDQAEQVHSYLKTGSKMKELVFPGATSTYARGVNNKGQVALCMGNRPGRSFGGVYDSTKNIYYRIDHPGNVDTCVEAINDKQELVGEYSPPNSPTSSGFVATGTLP